MEILIGYIGDGRNSGIDKYILRVLGILRDAGHRADVLTSRADAGLRARLAEEYGAALYEIPALRHPMRQYAAVRRILREHRCDAAYFNISETVNCVGALAAKHCGVRVVLHSHNSGVGGALPAVRWARAACGALFRPLLCRTGDVFCACSEKAGRWLFTKRARASGRYHVIYNPIPLADYAFQPEKRRAARAALGLSDAFVVGHVGNFVYAKNSAFLLDILAALLKTTPNAVLLSVGDGPEREAVTARAAALGLDGHARFLGVRDDVPTLMQAMDAFVLPSFFEGLPISAIEAQAAGLAVFLSDAVTREVSMGGRCYFLSLDAGAAHWAARIAREFPYARGDAANAPGAARFDIEAQRRTILGCLTEKG